MSLRAALVELIGAEIQQRTVALAGREIQMHFRQLTDAEGREVFGVVDGESDEDRGRRIMRGLVLQSVCDESGAPLSTKQEVEDLPGAVLQVLFSAAAATNNLTVTSAAATGEAAEAPSPNG